MWGEMNQKQTGIDRREVMIAYQSFAFRDGRWVPT